ncbi:MAG: hypothetical protein AAGC56_06550 [Pseudomonadota bacterium]
MAEFRTYTALVAFERDGDGGVEFVPPDAKGAYGYVAVLAADEELLVRTVEGDFAKAGLKVVKISEITEVSRDDFPADLDRRLAANVAAWTPPGRTVWGTIHVVAGEDKQ